jgi:hypothetical protein
VGGEISHDGDPTLTRHMTNSVIVKGSRKKPRPGEPDDLPSYYLKLAKRGDGLWIDAAVAAVLAHLARGQAIEDNIFAEEEVEPWAFFA